MKNVWMVLLFGLFVFTGCAPAIVIFESTDESGAVLDITGDWIGNTELLSEKHFRDNQAAYDIAVTNENKIKEQLDLKLSLFRGSNKNEYVGKIVEKYLNQPNSFYKYQSENLKLSGNLNKANFEYADTLAKDFSVSTKIEGKFQNNSFKGLFYRNIYGKIIMQNSIGDLISSENTKTLLVYSIIFTKIK